MIKDLSAEQKEMQQLARKFTKEEIIPTAAHFDKTGEVKKGEISVRSYMIVYKKKRRGKNVFDIFRGVAMGAVVLFFELLILMFLAKARPYFRASQVHQHHCTVL
jgi:hypothetical protein